MNIRYWNKKELLPTSIYISNFFFAIVGSQYFPMSIHNEYYD